MVSCLVLINLMDTILFCLTTTLALAVADSLDGKVFLQISYDHHNHKPLTVTDNTGVTTYHYRNDGLLASDSTQRY